MCGFMTNEYGAGKLSIMKCDQCRDGYLVVKSSSRDSNFFLGCTNYRKDGTGCGKVLGKQQYYEMFGLSPDIADTRDVSPPETGVKEPATVKTDDPEPISCPAVVVSKADVKGVLYNGHDLNDVVYTVLQCLSEVSEKRYYDAEVLIDILRGSKNPRVTLTETGAMGNFGALGNLPREDLEIILDWLVKNRFALKTKDKRPLLHPTYEGVHYAEKITPSALKKLKDALQKWTGNGSCFACGDKVGRRADAIYEEHCDKFGWRASCKEQFGPRKRLFAENATPEGYSVWMIVHNSSYEPYEEKFNWYDYIKGDTIEEVWLCGAAGKFFEDVSVRVTFVKTSDGYEFYGIYKPSGVEERVLNGKKRQVKIYKRIGNIYPEK